MGNEGVEGGLSEEKECLKEHIMWYNVTLDFVSSVVAGGQEAMTLPTGQSQKGA